ncbi:MAG: gamma-glutamyl-gamma-aminobutyrate hydrolase family protein [Arhodomonas sp.]|nr:gamma-glutamyl-gamma-aminobutyrate hydrolase family protein [Arhodomonas sp.]
MAGALPRHLHAGDGLAEVRANGVVISGGHDVDPVLYAQTPAVRPRYDPERDAFESRVIDAALAQGLPLLGICRGAQLLNVYRGGSLHQSLRDRRRATSGRRTLLPVKTLSLVAGTRLARILGNGRIRANSLHDQAIDRLGDGLRVAARDADGIVQAVEVADPAGAFVIGVQWHPEFLLYGRRQRSIFRALVDAARHSAAAPLVPGALA